MKLGIQIGKMLIMMKVNNQLHNILRLMQKTFQGITANTMLLLLFTTFKKMKIDGKKL